jgi:hypothetical protein
VKVKCHSWLKDMDKGHKYAKEYLNLELKPKVKTSPLPTPGAKGNLSPE